MPLFLFFTLALVQTALLFKLKLELVQVTRNFALLMARQDGESGRELKFQQCLRGTRLRAYSPHYRLDSVGLPESSLPAAAQGALSYFASGLLGERLTVSCLVPAHGALRIFFPLGAELNETLVFKAGPWRNPGLRIFKSILGL